MAKNAKRQRRRKREPLVHQHLENVSRDLFEKHPDIVKQFIGRNAGIYALYKKDKILRRARDGAARPAKSAR